MTTKSSEFTDSLDRVSKRLGGVDRKLLSAEEILSRLETRDQQRDKRVQIRENELREKYDSIGR